MFTTGANLELCKSYISHFNNKKKTWLAESAEKANLKNSIMNVSSLTFSFLWADMDKTLKNFYVVVKSEGYFVTLWNPREIDKFKGSKFLNFLKKVFILVKKTSITTTYVRKCLILTLKDKFLC